MTLLAVLATFFALGIGEAQAGCGKEPGLMYQNNNNEAWVDYKACIEKEAKEAALADCEKLKPGPIPLYGRSQESYDSCIKNATVNGLTGTAFGYASRTAGTPGVSGTCMTKDLGKNSGKWGGQAVNKNCSDKETAAMSKEQITDCWQKAVLGGLYDLAGKATFVMYEKICTGALPFMMVAFAIWLAMRLMAHLSSFTEENPNEVWNEVLQKLFLCFACGLIANSTDTMLWVLNAVVFPVYTALLELGSAMLTSTGKDAGALAMFGEDIPGWGDNVGSTMICKAGDLTSANAMKAGSAGFPSAPKEMMSCLVCGVNTKLSVGFPIALKVMRGGEGVGNSLMMILVGLIVYCSFLFVKLGFVFSLVDSIFKMAMILVIYPILIVGFPFKKTRKWVGRGFLQILTSAGFMMFVAVLMTLAILAFQTLISAKPCLFGNQALCEKLLASDPEVIAYNGCKADKEKKLTGAALDAELQECKTLHRAGAAKTLIKEQDAFEGMSVTIVVLLLSCFLLLNTVKIAKDLTGSLIGEGVSDAFQKKLETVGKLAVDWITGGAVGLAKKLMAKGGSKGKDAGNKLADAAKDDKKDDDKNDEGGADAQVEQDE
jgi:hypothetical protein